MPEAGRFGFNAGAGRPLEETLRWAAESAFTYVDFNADRAPNGVHDFDDARVRRVRDFQERHGLHVGIHTSSAVNNAEIAPFVGEAVDEYLRANVALAQRLGCEWVIVHGGYHFGDVDRRQEAAVARLQRLHDFAVARQVPLWFENHNTEPERAEIHYFSVRRARGCFSVTSRSVQPGSAQAQSQCVRESAVAYRGDYGANYGTSEERVRARGRRSAGSDRSLRTPLGSATLPGDRRS